MKCPALNNFSIFAADLAVVNLLVDLAVDLPVELVVELINFVVDLTDID